MADSIADMRAKFNRMGLVSDRDIVVLWGAHILDRAQEGRSDFDSPWTGKALKLDNSYFKELLKVHKDELMKIELMVLQERWLVELLKEEPEGLLLFPSDRLLMTSYLFCRYVIMYAKRPRLFLKEYELSHMKLSELGFIKRPPFPLYCYKKKEGNVLPLTIAGMAIAASIMMIWYHIRARNEDNRISLLGPCNFDKLQSIRKKKMALMKQQRRRIP